MNMDRRGRYGFPKYRSEAVATSSISTKGELDSLILRVLAKWDTGVSYRDIQEL